MLLQRSSTFVVRYKQNETVNVRNRRYTENWDPVIPLFYKKCKFNDTEIQFSDIYAVTQRKSSAVYSLLQVIKLYSLEADLSQIQQLWQDKSTKPYSYNWKFITENNYYLSTLKSMFCNHLFNVSRLDLFCHNLLARC